MTDVRVGDLVKFTSKKDPEVSFTSRVHYWNTRNPIYTSAVLGTQDVREFDFEVLDRPAPPIDEELLSEAVQAFRRGQGYRPPAIDEHLTVYGNGVKAVINLVREYDQKNATKEN